MLALLATIALAAPPVAPAAAPLPDPTDQAVVYYNARMALREGNALEATKLWLLRNAVESQTDVVSAHDVDFRSVTWAAMGYLGLCPDGLPTDDDGVGLWPLALHNWTIRNRRPPPPEPEASPFAAFEIGRMQRYVAIHDVLDADELRAVSLQRGGCWWRWRILTEVGTVFDSLEDARLAAVALRRLLREALVTLDWSRVVGRAAIEARIFDLNLRIAGFSARNARRAQREQVRSGRERGLSRAEVRALRREGLFIDPDRESQGILDRSLSWTTEEWMTLSSDRRQYLFAKALENAATKERAQPLALSIVDRLIAERRGGQVQAWLAHAAPDEDLRRLIWSGERGEKLLSLDPATGFRERGIIALHRGVDQLGAGQLTNALRSLAYALRWAETSRREERVSNLARRWLSFVASKFQVDDELLAMLRNVVPRADYNAVLEDQIWQAALSADAASFARCIRNQRGRGALVRRAERLRPLADGDTGKFADQLLGDLDETPSFALRFMGRFLERLQASDATIRGRYLPLLREMKRALEAYTDTDDGQTRQRRAETLIQTIRATIDGVVPLTDEASAADRAAALSPEAGVFVGSVRLAPSDPLPWPFARPETRAPSVFLPLILRPEEWAADDGEFIFGWRVVEP